MTENLIESIRIAVAEGASDEARAFGANACRTLLAVLETKAGDPLAAGAPAPTAPSPQVAAIASALKNVPTDQLADLLIAKLRTLVPPDAQPTTSVRRINIPLVAAPNLKATP